MAPSLSSNALSEFPVHAVVARRRSVRRPLRHSVVDPVGGAAQRAVHTAVGGGVGPRGGKHVAEGGKKGVKRGGKKKKKKKEKKKRRK